MKTFKFYGVSGNQYKLDDTIWEALADAFYEESWLRSIQKRDFNNTFQDEPLATVTIKETKPGDVGTFTGYELIDVEDGHVWLAIGTDYCEFIFDYTAKGEVLPEEVEEEEEFQRIFDYESSKWLDFIS